MAVDYVIVDAIVGVIVDVNDEADGVALDVQAAAADYYSYR